MKATCVAILLVLGVTSGATGAPCEEPSPYPEALCHYRQRNWAEAERGFSEIVTAAAEEPETIKALYFRARSRMHLKRWEEASADLIAVHRMYPAFFQEWNGDFLLGECRRMLGKD